MAKIIRDPAGFAKHTYDLIIIGGGIYGVMLSFEASKRGLKSLLLEKADFGGATTFNSLRIIHGGFRYLQTLDLLRFRESVAERKWFLKTFPGFVKPLACLMPLYNRGIHRAPILRIATLVNDTLSRNRNQGVRSDQLLPECKILSPSETIDRSPLVDPKGLKAGVVWYDGCMLNSQRIVIEILRRARSGGASSLNYVEALELLRDGDDVKGVWARDLISQQSYQFRSRVVVNAAGPWCRSLAINFDRDKPELFKSSIAWNVLLNRPVRSSNALAVRSQMFKARTYFLIPWNNRLLVGTGHAPWTGGPDRVAADEKILTEFLADLNLGVPSLNVKLSDIIHVFSGLLPVKKSGGIQLTGREVLIDHAGVSGPRGLYSVSGVKFTTSRRVAEKVIQKIFPDREILRDGDEISPDESTKFESRRGIFDLSDFPNTDATKLQAALKSLVDDECVQYPDDLIYRRTNIWENPEIAKAILPQIHDIIKHDDFYPGKEISS